MLSYGIWTLADKFVINYHPREVYIMYTAPDFEIVAVEASDIITVSLATKEGDNEYSAPANWWD